MREYTDQLQRILCTVSYSGVPPKSRNILSQSGRPLLDNGLLKQVSETAHTDTSIAGQRLNKHCSHNNQYARDKINVLPKN
jgi:hypothetical protein